MDAAQEAQNREAFHHPVVNTLEWRLFYIPSFKIYQGVAGLYDYGPRGCAVKSNFLAFLRQTSIRPTVRPLARRRQSRKVVWFKVEPRKFNIHFIQSCWRWLLELGQNHSLEDKGQKGCFNLKCSIHGNIPLLRLPFAGYFYVRSIDYLARTIHLYDPDRCIPGRLMNSNLSSFYPLKAVDGYKNYTFFSCPREVIVRSNFSTTVDCLGKLSWKWLPRC